MKDYVNLVKCTWTHYVSVFCIVIAYFVNCNYYMIKDMGLSRNKQTLYDFSYMYLDRITNDNLCGLYITVGIMVFALVVRHLAFASREKFEFLHTIPVKKNAMLRFDYVSHLAIGVVCWFINFMTYFVVQNTHNKAAAAGDTNLLAQADGYTMGLWKSGIHYLLFLILIYNILYVGILACKNSVIGMVIACVAMFVVTEIGYYRPDIEQYYYLGSFLKKCSRNIVSSHASYVAILLGFNVLVVFILVGIAHYRNIASGRWFYFKWMEYVCIFLLGAMSYYVAEEFVWYLFAFVIGIGVTIVAFIVYTMQEKLMVGGELHEENV
ncbi:MAG: hypothetical protein Q4D51_12840 [Eubacteriales bacterium]|nr:hypothetical protein [Eubacteriales bacterium]